VTLEIRDLAFDDDAELAAFHGVTVRSSTADGRPWVRAWTLAECTQELRDPDETERVEACAAYVDGVLVGAAVQWFFLLDNTDKTALEVNVDPAFRRRGVGSALVEYVVQRAAAAGRIGIVVEDASYSFAERGSAGVMAFAEKLGFREANMEIHRDLALPVADELLDAIAAEAAPHHAAYEIVLAVGSLPDALIPSYCTLHNQLAVEAPGGEVQWEPESWTPEIYASVVKKLHNVDRTRYTTVAVLDGEVVALTDLVTTAGESKAQQWYTIVARAHRGHRLGAAVKVANLRQAQLAEPHLTVVATQNAETNANMVDINDRLGFVPLACVPTLLRDLLP
jgi:GNAT superfamily N-acetyltransferase/RimJ/RimL family protein N-acetyltransferase